MRQTLCSLLIPWHFDVQFAKLIMVYWWLQIFAGNFRPSSIILPVCVGPSNDTLSGKSIQFVMLNVLCAFGASIYLGALPRRENWSVLQLPILNIIGNFGMNKSGQEMPRHEMRFEWASFHFILSLLIIFFSSKVPLFAHRFSLSVHMLCLVALKSILDMHFP